MFKTTLKFVRIRILVTCYSMAFMGAVVTDKISLKTVLTIFVLIAWYIHAASANDYSDRYIDAINLKDATDRPMVSENGSARQLWKIHFAAGVIALLLSYFYGYRALTLTLAMLILNYAYSIKPIRISDRGIASQLLLAVAYVYFPFSLGFWSSGSPAHYPWLLSFGLYLGFVGRLLLKDFRDVKGDKKFGKMTFVLRHGVASTCLASALFWAAALAVVGYSTEFSPGLLIVSSLGLVQVCIFLRDLANNPNVADQTKIVAIIAKSANSTIMAVLAFYLCRRQPSLSPAELVLIPATVGVGLLGLNWWRYAQSVMPRSDYKLSA